MNTDGESLPFQVLEMDHCALVPKDPALCEAFLTSLLGLPTLGKETVKEQRVHVTMVQPSILDPNTHGHHPRLEILTPESAESPIAGFLAKRGGGVHHIALKVDNLERARQFLQEKGVEFTTTHPGRGFGDSLTLFVRPRSTGGLLVELVQAPPP